MRRAYKLGRQCEEPNASGRQALARVAKGLHPWQARDKATGREVKRGTLRGERAFDDVAGVWLEASVGTVVTSSSGRGFRKYTGTAGVAIKHKNDPKGRRGELSGHLKGDTVDEGTDGVDVSEVRAFGNEDGQGPCFEEPPFWQGNEMEDTEADVFGHGGDLDQPTEDPPPPPIDLAATDHGVRRLAAEIGEGDEESQGPRVKRGKSWRCTVIRGTTEADRVRHVADVWIDGDGQCVKYRGDGTRTEVLHDIAGTDLGKKRGSYAIVIPEANTRLVFCGTREVDEFLGEWARRAVDGGEGSGMGAAQVHGGDDERAIARFRATRARERVEHLRARVLAREAARTERDTQGEAGPGKVTEPVPMIPAPATPRLQPNEERGTLDLTREYGDGCGCRGRRHEACARKVRPRQDDAGGGKDGDADDGDEHAEQDATDIRARPRYRPPPVDRGIRIGEGTGQGDVGLRAPNGPCIHHDLHNHHQGGSGTRDREPSTETVTEIAHRRRGNHLDGSADVLTGTRKKGWDEGRCEEEEEGGKEDHGQLKEEGGGRHKDNEQEQEEDGKEEDDEGRTSGGEGTRRRIHLIQPHHHRHHDHSSPGDPIGARRTGSRRRLEGSNGHTAHPPEARNRSEVAQGPDRGRQPRHRLCGKLKQRPQRQQQDQQQQQHGNYGPAVRKRQREDGLTNCPPAASPPPQSVMAMGNGGRRK